MKVHVNLVCGKCGTFVEELDDSTPNTVVLKCVSCGDLLGTVDECKAYLEKSRADVLKRLTESLKPGRPRR
jgi:uncharacterized Zn finger protein